MYDSSESSSATTETASASTSGNLPVPDLYYSNLDKDTLTEIARSGFSDMLWDQERNYLYKKAIEKELRRLLDKKYKKDEKNEKDKRDEKDEKDEKDKKDEKDEKDKKDEKDDRDIKCLDIGAGTGLLSMFMARVLFEYEKENPKINPHNNSVLALEQFYYSYLNANEIITLNNFHNMIDLQYASSIDDKYLSQWTSRTDKANFLAAEVFDTELIGEGALEIYRKAKALLLDTNAIIVPKRAHIYCQLIESKELVDGHLFRPPRFIKNWFRFDHDETFNNSHINYCFGSLSQLNDMQLNSLKINEFRIISDVKVAFEIDFSDPPEKLNVSNDIKFRVLNEPKDKENVCVTFWWDLDMDDEGEYVLSCAPYWSRRGVDYTKLYSDQPILDLSTVYTTINPVLGKRNVDAELTFLMERYSKYIQEFGIPYPQVIEDNFEKFRLSMQWRDHWMQAVYYLPKNWHSSQKTKDFFEITAHRNDFLFWFTQKNSEQAQHSGQPAINQNEQPLCTCGNHRTYSRNQIRQINDVKTTILLAKYFKSDFSSNLLDRSSSDYILIVGGKGIITYIAAKIMPDAKLYLYSKEPANHFMTEIFQKEEIDKRIQNVSSLTYLDVLINIVVKDPLVDLDKYPWLDLHEFLSVYRTLAAKRVPTPMPAMTTFKVLPICFDHLWKMRYILGKIDHLDIQPFNTMLKRALENEPRQYEMYSLHEYDGILLANPVTIAEITTANLETYTKKSNVTFDFNLDEIRNYFSNKYGKFDLKANRSIFDQQLEAVEPFKRQFNNVAFVIYPEYSHLVDTGPSERPSYLKEVKWSKFFKQAVYFMFEFNRDSLNDINIQNIKVKLTLDYDFSQPKNKFELSHEIVDYKMKKN